MKTTHITLLGALAIILLITATLANRSMASKSSISKTIKGDGFIVLELFTSEGCSSCPPADELAAKVQREAGDKPVYVLSYHVDYWDHQGWRDIFSNAEYGKRQYRYALKLGSQVYTPQVVANGKTEFTGSNKAAMNYALESSLKGTPASTLKLQGKQQARKLNISYQLTGNSDDSELLIAVVQKSAVHQIKRGENEGRTLTHSQIVRGLHTFEPGKKDSGQVSIFLPEDFSLSGWEVVGLLQDKKSMGIYAANRAVLQSH